LGERPQPESYQATILTVISGSMLKNTQHNESTIYVSGDLLRIDTLTPTRTITLKKGQQTWVIGPDGNVSQLDQEQTSLAQKTKKLFVPAHQDQMIQKIIFPQNTLAK
jgi:outer membrane lipoprotein-sorting protein